MTNVRAGQKLAPHQDLGVKVATPVGTLVGQLLFGWLADVVGRKKMCELHSVLFYTTHSRFQMVLS